MSRREKKLKGIKFEKGANISNFELSWIENFGNGAKSFPRGYESARNYGTEIALLPRTHIKECHAYLKMLQIQFCAKT